MEIELRVNSLVFGKRELQACACLLPNAFNSRSSGLHERADRLHVSLWRLEEFCYLHHEPGVVNELHALQLHGQVCVGRSIQWVVLESEEEEWVFFVLTIFIFIFVLGRLIIIELFNALVVRNRRCILDCDDLGKEAALGCTVVKAHTLERDFDKHGIRTLQELSTEGVKEQPEDLVGFAMGIALECEAAGSQAHIDL